MIPDTVRAETLHIEMHDQRRMRLLLTTTDGAARADLDLSDAERAALPHVAALCGHTEHCPGRVDMLTGLFVRTLASLGRQRPAVIVRPGPQPAFWLHIPGATPLEMELNRIDALALLVSQRTDVAVETSARRGGAATTA